MPDLLDEITYPLAVAVPEFHHSPDFKDVYAAFIQAQGEFTPVQKNKTATVKGRSRSGSDYEYGYKYADLADVLAMAVPVLTKHGLGLMQPYVMVGGQLRVVTRLIHSSGQWLQSHGLALAENLLPQDFGSLSTYWRRYDVCSLLGIAADEDVDGQRSAETPKGAESRQVRQPKATQPAEQPSSEAQELLDRRDKIIEELKELLPGRALGQRARAMFPQHETTKTLTVTDLEHLRDVLLKEKTDAEKRALLVQEPETVNTETSSGMPSDIPPDVAALFEEGKLTTAARLSSGPRIGKGLSQRLHKLIGIHKIHTEKELEEDFLIPNGVEHASELPRDMYESLCAWAEGTLQEGESIVEKE